MDKFHQTTAKSKAAPFEAIDLSIYKLSARCLAFSTSEDRLLLWIVAFQFRYYEITGNGTDYTVIWEEQDNPSSTSKCDKICIHLSMNTSTGEEKLVTITVFGTTGRILVQGKKYDEWSKFDNIPQAPQQQQNFPPQHYNVQSFSPSHLVAVAVFAWNINGLSSTLLGEKLQNVD